MKYFINLSFLLLAFNSISAQNQIIAQVIEKQKPHIMQIPIIFDKQRKALTLEYMQQHYAMTQTEPTIIPKMVVVHWTVIPTLEQTFATFNPATLSSSRNKIKSASALNVSSQFVIDRGGTIYQLLPETTMARHVIGLNHAAIGIENIADGKELPMTPAQLDANTMLITYLMGKYNIEHVIGHSEYQLFKNHPLWKEKDENYITHKTDPDIEFMHKLRARLPAGILKPLPTL
ncbi:MAG: N-acetylmuramoyl-L-alanine amidase [Paraglaciecola sp.]|nr:N-acetylmuramoyl-L-alanine amidase [Paraglaciecola sp.]